MPAPAPAPRLWRGGRVFTGQRYVEAVYAEDGRVVAAGPEGAVRRAAPTGTEVIDLEGGLAVPGLIDAHFHWLASVVEPDSFDLRRCDDIPELLGQLQRRVQSVSSGPVIGGGWDQERFAEHRYPSRDDLDAVESERPVVLFRVCRHVAVVNSVALERAGLRDDTPDPEGGRIGRDPGGRLSGLLFDHALSFVQDVVAGAFRSRPRYARAVLERAASFGVTTLGAMSAVPAEIDMAREIATAAGIPVRLRFYLLSDPVRGVPPRSAGDSGTELRVCGLKIALDGSFGARTAWLETEYSDDPGNIGLPLERTDGLRERLLEAEEAGWPVALHAIGDRALRFAIESLIGHRWSLPPRIEHASLVPPPLLDRLAELRPSLVVQPQFVESDWWLEERLGPSRALWAYPFRALIDRGLVVAGSSDAPVERLDPWAGLRVATRRCGLTVEEAFRMYTGSGAAALGEATLGSLETGSAADLVVLSTSSLAAAIESPAPVSSVWKGGERVGAGALEPDGDI